MESTLKRPYRDPQVTAASYRKAFLKFLYKLAPEVAAELRLFGPRYKELFGDQFVDQRGRAGSMIMESGTLEELDILFEITGDPRYNNITDGDLTDTERNTATAVLDLRNEIEKFISKYGLEKPWLRYAVLETLMHLAASPSLKGGLFLSEAFMSFSNDPPVFHLPLWDPTVQSLKEYRKEARALFKRTLHQYTKEINEVASRAYVSAKGRPHDTDRVKWLIRWTVQQRTASDIAKEFSISEKGFWEGLQKFAEYDLPVRRKNDTEV